MCILYEIHEANLKEPQIASDTVQLTSASGMALENPDKRSGSPCAALNREINISKKTHTHTQDLTF